MRFLVWRLNCNYGLQKNLALAPIRILLPLERVGGTKVKTRIDGGREPARLLSHRSKHRCAVFGCFPRDIARSLILVRSSQEWNHRRKMSHFYIIYIAVWLLLLLLLYWYCWWGFDLLFTSWSLVLWGNICLSVRVKPEDIGGQKIKCRTYVHSWKTHFQVCTYSYISLLYVLGART